MDIRSPRRSNRRNRRGATSFQMVVLMVPVLFGFMGFAVDYGRLYLIRAELKSAANAAALAAAGRLGGYEAALDFASAAAQTAVAEAGGIANKIDFGGRAVGDSEGTFVSTVQEPGFHETVESATGAGEGGGGGASGSTAKHVRLTMTAEAPTIFWRFLPIGQEGRVNLQVAAAAGMSAPLCTACGIESIVVAARDATEEENFGFEAGTRYTLGYSCTGPLAPQPLAGSTIRVPYLLLNRWDQDSEVPEQTQAFRIGISGLPGNVAEAKSCIYGGPRPDGASEAQWESAAASPCNQNNVPAAVRGFVCGLANRFEAGVYTGCETVQDSDVWAQSPLPDADIQDTDDFAGTYAGNLRRVVTVAIAEDLANPTAIVILGFRQFLLNPIANTTNINPLDNNARFLATYIGSPMPLKSGRVSGCQFNFGPGKAVLHQ